MSSPALHERRRHPRVQPSRDVHLSIPVVIDVKVLDISGTGILFWCESSLAVGQRAQIRTVIDRQPFAATVEIVRLDRAPGPEGRSCGARFIGLDEANRARLDTFLAV